MLFSRCIDTAYTFEGESLLQSLQSDPRSSSQGEPLAQMLSFLPPYLSCLPISTSLRCFTDRLSFLDSAMTTPHVQRAFPKKASASEMVLRTVGGRRFGSGKSKS